ncbi:MAG: divalent metal cation transporter [Sphingobacteriales bacterium]|nr:divalent metal cation transporter [Sphingobacteriales bacterium]
MSIPQKLKAKLLRTWNALGPGLITGASDDDPSGIATYSQAGAKFGTKLLWTAIATYPLMIAIQEMCAKIGLITNKGLMGVIKTHYSKKVLYLILLVSFPSIILNVGADIAGMGAVGNLIFPKVPAFIFSIVFTVSLLYATIFWNYKRISYILKWLCITLFGYLIIPFIADTDWRQTIRSTFLPSFEMDTNYLMTLVGILGTTISPYLFFWQASMEVEEENQKHLVVDKTIISDMKMDIRIGLLLTNLVFYFIILTTGTVLYKAGIFQIDTVDQAALALKPLAGDASYILFAIGVLGTGALAIPVLAGSLSYMMSELFGWEEGLDKKFLEAKGFYITLIISMTLGLIINFTGISPVKMLFYTAVLYGVIAPVLIALILHISNNKKIMGEYTNSRWLNITGFITLVLMTVAAGLMIYSEIKK